MPKTHVPAVRPGWIARPDLVAALNDATEVPLVTLVAPAGYGKSTLLALWLADPSRRRTVVVLTVDVRDNDPVVLWSDIVAALAATVPGPSWAVPARLLRVAGPDIGAVVLPALRAALVAATGPAGVTLALDDCHLITDPVCHRQLAMLTGMLPPGCQLLLATRNRPPVPVARLRACGDLLELGLHDLRLTGPQAAELGNTVAGRDLSPATLQALTELTEGWPAAVHLAARALRDRTGAHAVPAGVHHCIDDYITEEILDALPSAQATALARTAVLERWTVPLCRHVAGADLPMTASQRPAGLPLTALDDSDEWFRHHPLVQQALLRRLRRDEPGLIVHLHQRAAIWYTGHGFAEDAIDHTLAAADADAATDLIASMCITFVDTGRRVIVRGRLDRLGGDAIARSLPASVITAWIAALNGDRAAITPWLHAVEHSPGTHDLAAGARRLAEDAEPVHRTAAPQPARSRTALSRQEHALLRLLPTALTLRQLAGHRHVTLNTIKSQTRSIYRKLGAAGRTDAVREARAQGLIPQLEDVP